MKNNLDNINQLQNIYKVINYVIIANKNNEKKYISINHDDNRLNYTNALNKAIKFYSYKNAIDFVNKHHIKCYKIYKINVSFEIIKE